jgi:LPXTG-site transpeptidase (sortase) family protein
MSETAYTEEVSTSDGSKNESVVPDDETLTLTIPEMEIEDATVPSARNVEMNANDWRTSNILTSHVAVHLEGTGFPWEEEANVFIVGHRLGYEDTPSELAFYYISDLEKGDEIFVTDSHGTEYTYEVLGSTLVDDTDLSVLETIEGKNMLSLQSFIPEKSDEFSLTDSMYPFDIISSQTTVTGPDSSTFSQPSTAQSTNSELSYSDERFVVQAELIDES